MKGLDVSRGYFEEYGRPMLEENFKDLLPLVAVGFVGAGSERFGFDDELSRDHDFEAGFSIFLPGEDVVDRRTAFLLERAYAKLPKEYMGIKRALVSPVGGSRCGPVRTADFYLSEIGSPDGNLTLEQWLRTPDSVLAEATNGDVFYDEYGEFTAIRERLLCMPRDVRLKRVAGNLLLMAQAGQYNYTRTLSHGEREAASVAAHTFADSAMKVLFHLADRYMPYYKWSYRALCELPDLGEIPSLLSFIMTSGDGDDNICSQKYDKIEQVSSLIIGKLIDFELTKASCGDLEKHAYSVNDGIADANIRNLSVFAAV